MRSFSGGHVTTPGDAGPARSGDLRKWIFEDVVTATAGRIPRGESRASCLFTGSEVAHACCHIRTRRADHPACDGGKVSTDKYLSQLRTRLSATHARVIKELEELEFVAFADIGYGYFVWMCHPNVGDTTELTKSAFTRDMLLAPGGMFSSGGKPSPWLRFNVGHTGKLAINALRALLARH